MFLLVGLPGMAVWLNTTYPRACERMCTIYRTRGTQCLILGAVNVIVGFLLATVLGETKLAPLGILAVLILVALGVLAVMGFAAAFRAFGERLVSDPATANPAKTVALGGITLEVAFLVPILGQLLLLGVLFRGVGAAVATLLSRGRTSATPATPVTPAEADPPTPPEIETEA
jgi:hypothetical protein